MSEMITISKKEYLRLQMDALTLNALERGGVDNWEWYGESLDDEYSENYEKLEEEYRKTDK
jgi:hypothetical protein